MSTVTSTMKRLCISVALALALTGALTAAQASAEVKLTTNTIWAPTYFPSGGEAQVAVQVANAGDTAAADGATVTLQLPDTITFDGTYFIGIYSNPSGPLGPTSCSGAGTSTITCTAVGKSAGGDPLKARSRAPMLRFDVDVAAGSEGLYPATTSVSSAEQPQPSVEPRLMRVSDTPRGFGFDPDNLAAAARHADGSDYTPAGGHPYDAHASVRFGMLFSPDLFGFGACLTTAAMVPESCYDGGAVGDLGTTLPPGFLGDPQAVAECPDHLFPLECPPESQIGWIELFAPGVKGSGAEGPDATEIVAIYNMVPPPQMPAQFAFYVPFAGAQRINASVRADGDYGVTLSASNITEAGITTVSNVVVWGNPSDPSHDIQRCPRLNFVTYTCTSETKNMVPSSWEDLPPKAFLSNPTDCADEPHTTVFMGTYLERAPLDNLEDPRWRKMTLDHPFHTDCAAVPFDPTIDFETQSKQADTPTGLDVHLHIPRDEDRDASGVADDSDYAGRVQAHLKRAKVVLPDGLAFNASAADGLQACSPEQIGLKTAPGEVPYRFNNVEPTCPPASKVAAAEIISPLLEQKLIGEVFLAAQNQNPFDSTFAVYIVVREPSILVKLPGKVELNEATGQITTTFDENPQLPFSDLEMDFFGGPRAALATPQTCGTFTTVSEFTPWSAADPRNPTPSEIVVDKDPFSVDSAPNGQGCVTDKAQLPLNAGLNAGSANPIAGAKSPFDIQITRPDGNQELEKLEISPPPGFVASLRGIPYCSEAQIAAAASRGSGKAEQESSSCPAASQVGTTNVGAGAGSNPFYAQGKLYLAGPYKGETLSVVAVTPAVAGPFDLGNVVVRSALKINPLTARITAVSDSLPRTIDGVPLRIKDIRIALDRPNWAINPTNCEAMSVDVTAYGVDGAVSKPSNRYQLRDCEKLGFKPNLSIHLKGGTKRGDHPSLFAVLKTRPGDANIARAAVTLPSSAFLDQAHIRTICTRVQYAADTCPAGATYGYAKATTPLLDNPIEGNVILRSSDNKLPDLVGRLRGIANIEAVGRIDSVKGGIRNTFDVIPDAPFDVFTLTMQGGNKGLVINSKNLCATTNRATVKFTAQNGRRYNYRPKVIADGCKKARKGKNGKRGKGRARARR